MRKHKINRPGHVHVQWSDSIFGHSFFKKRHLPEFVHKNM